MDKYTFLECLGHDVAVIFGYGFLAVDGFSCTLHEINVRSGVVMFGDEMTIFINLTFLGEAGGTHIGAKKIFKFNKIVTEILCH